MALRDQPYIPLYIQDFLTDEKLIECSAQSTGVYVRLMCIMHKSEDYGKILLKQKDKQTTEQTKNFALKVAKQMPYSLDVVTSAITELLTEGVIHIEGDFLCQKRMIKDNSLSLLRAKAGKKGGKFAQAKIKANKQANTEDEIEYEIEDEIIIIGEKKDFWVGVKPKYVEDKLITIYDLQEYFKGTNQLEGLQRTKNTDFEGFMKEKPSALFDDANHLYNSFLLHHKTNIQTESENHHLI